MVIVLLIIAFGRACRAENWTIEDYETTIKENEYKINQCEKIKKQLHITAKLIREQEDYNIEFVTSLSNEWHNQNNSQNNLKDINKNLYTKLEELKLSQKKFIGNFTITHYCVENYRHICNNGNAFTTATGTVPTPGRTIAVDPRKIPYGSKVVIDGHTYIAEDTGGAIKNNKLDICVATHSEALQKGVRRNVPVYIIKE
jgi:3D (Asp-Asp-Asp) domain-containing protein